jgi:hypothetical protein
LGFIRQAFKNRVPDNLIVADYVELPEGVAQGDYRATQLLGKAERDLIEALEAERTAHEIMARLPADKSARQMLLEQSDAFGERMSWDVVVQQFFLPALVHAASREIPRGPRVR